MAGDRVVLRTACPDDVDELSRLEAACWPEGLAADASQLHARIAAYRDGQWVAELDGRLLGYSSAQRIEPGLLDSVPLDYETVTDGDRFTATHDDNGTIYQLVGVSSHPESRGQGIGRQLVDHQIASMSTRSSFPKSTVCGPAPPAATSHPTNRSATTSTSHPQAPHPTRRSPFTSTAVPGSCRATTTFEPSTSSASEQAC